MWGLEELLKEQSAPDDFSLIFDKVQDTRSRLASALELSGLTMVAIDDLEGELRNAHWADEQNRHVYVTHTDLGMTNLITSVTLQSPDSTQTFKLLGHEFSSEPDRVTGEVARDYIKDLDELEEWIWKVLND